MTAWYDAINPEAPVLASQLEGFDGEALGFIGDLIAPKVPCTGPDATIFKFLGNETRTLYTNVRRAPRADVATIEWTVATGTKALEEYSARLPWDDAELAFAGDPIKAQYGSVAPIGEILALHKEYAIVSLITNNANYAGTSTATPATKWGQAGDTPMDQVDVAILEIRKQTGRNPDFMVLGYEVSQEMTSMAEFTGLIASDQDQILTNRLLSDYWKIPLILNGMDMYYDHDLGYWVDLWGDIIVFGVRGRVDAIPTPGLVYQYINNSMTTAEVYREAKSKTTFYQATQMWLADMAANDYGYLLYDVVT